jgi:hypothetical protein
MTKFVGLLVKVVLTPVKGKERDMSEGHTAIGSGPFIRRQHILEGGLSLRPLKEKTLLETLDLSDKNVKHVYFVGGKPNLAPSFLYSLLNCEEGKEQIFGKSDLNLHNRVKVRMQL